MGALAAIAIPRDDDGRCDCYTKQRTCEPTSIRLQLWGGFQEPRRPQRGVGGDAAVEAMAK